jgi:Zn-dependent protease
MGPMGGGRSIKLVRVFGIPIGVDASWFIFLFLLIWLRSDAYKTQFPGHANRAFVLAIVFAFLFFGSILLHELGHAIVAVRNGVEIVGIDLWMFGGLARMKRDSPNWWVDFKISVAGPLVTLLLAALFFVVGGALAGFGDFVKAIDPFQISPVTPAQTVIADVCLINILLLAFNLLPGLPLDGGRIVRALVWWRTGDRNRATRVMAMTGRVLAYLLGAFGLYALVQGDVIGGVWSLFLALLIYQAARGAEVQTAVSSRIEHLHVSDVMDAEPVAVPAELPVGRALDEYFLRYGWDWFPVVDASGRFLGLVEREKLEAAPRDARVAEAVAPDTLSDFRVEVDAPLEALLGSEQLQQLGAIMAVDREGVLRGVVTIEQVARALQPFARTA